MHTHHCFSSRGIRRRELAASSSRRTSQHWIDTPIDFFLARVDNADTTCNRPRRRPSRCRVGDLGQPPFEKSPLGRVGDQRQAKPTRPTPSPPRSLRDPSASGPGLRAAQSRPRQQRVFGQVEILDRADEARQDAPVFAPVQLAEVHPWDAGTTGRTSIEPPTRSVGMRPAIASASSRA